MGSLGSNDCFQQGILSSFSFLLTLKLIPNPNELILQTRINGGLRQDTNTSDMLFDVKTLVSFCSQGTTLEAGSIIMTGTPEGNRMFSSSND